MDKEPAFAKALSKLRVRLQKISCDELGWSVRARGCLKRARCKNLWDVATRSSEDWLKVKNLGAGTLREIREKLFAYVARGETALVPEESKTDAEQSGPLKGSDPIKISPQDWARLVKDLKAANRGQEMMGETAAKIGAKWPESRYYEKLEDFLKPRLRDLLSIPFLGRKKVRTVIRCALAVLAEEQGEGGDSPAARAEKLKSIARALKAGAVEEALEAAFSLVAIHPQERQVLTLRYGLDGEPLRYREYVARLLGCSRTLARYVEERARQKLLRHPDLQSVLKEGFALLEPQFLRRLDGPVEGLVPDMAPIELLVRLGGWNALLVELWYEDLDDWLSQRTKKTEFGWLHGGARPARFESAVRVLADYLKSCGVPVPIAVATRDTGLSEPELRLACEHGAGWLVADFISPQRLSSQERRVLGVHVQTRDAASPLLLCHSLWPLFYPQRSQFDDRTSSFYREVGWFPRLLLRCGSEYVLRITPGWEIAHPDVRPLPPRERRLTAEDRPEKGREDSLHGFGLRLLKRRRLWRVGALVKEFAKAAKGKFARNSYAALFISHRAQRLAPGIWGVRGKAPTTADYESVLRPQDLECYVEARHAGADRTIFPLWQADLEYFWCRWAQQNLEAEDLFQSLLSVITPDEWSCPVAIRKKWKDRQRKEGHYRLSRPLPVPLVECPVAADDLLAAAGSVVGRGGACWIDLNLVRGTPVRSERVASVLALLVVTGVVEPARHWQDFHRATAAAPAIYQELGRLWAEGSLKKSARLIEWVRARTRVPQGKRRALGWIVPEEVDALIPVLGKRPRRLKNLD